MAGFVPAESRDTTGMSFSATNRAARRKKAMENSFTPKPKAPPATSTPDNAPTMGNTMTGSPVLLNPNSANTSMETRNDNAGILSGNSNGTGGDAAAKFKQRRRERGGGTGAKAAMRGEAV